MRLLDRTRLAARTALSGGAATLVAALALAPGAAAGAAPAPAGGMTMNCQTATFPGFDWEVLVDAEAVTDGTRTLLSLSFSDMPGIAPVPINGMEMTGEVVVEVAGVASTVSLTGAEDVTAAPNAPVPVPTVSGTFDGSEANLDVTVQSASFTVSGLTTLCPPAGTGNWALDPITAEEGEVPAPTEPPTEEPSGEPTDKPSDKPSKDPTDTGGKKGKPATGTAKFSCTLQEIGSPFDYNPKVTVAGSRSAADDSEVTLRATFSDIPGLAPVPIENGTMKVTASLEVGGEKVDFAESAPVNVAAHGKVPVPTMTATIDTDEETLPVKVTAFKFDFGEMQGMNFYSDCTGSGTLSKMTVGVGDMGDDEDPNNTGNDNATNTSTNAAPSLPKTGSGSAMLMFGLWASAFVLLGAALFLFLPRRRLTA